MSICTVNGLAHDIEAGSKTWGQLLATLERGEGLERVVVAAVRFAGVDQPTFREPESLDLKLDGIAPIDVERSTNGELIAFARETALGSLGALAESARQAADAFRLHDLKRAHSRLADIVSAFKLLHSLTGIVRHSEASSRPGEAETPGDEFVKRLQGSLESLIDFQVNEDWISVADVLEYEVADLLPHWAAVIRATGDGEQQSVELAARSMS
ncbi:MAG: hypothetical protein ABJA98_04885 [Acidobacteriota bacterium]